VEVSECTASASVVDPLRALGDQAGEQEVRGLLDTVLVLAWKLRAGTLGQPENRMIWLTTASASGTDRAGKGRCCRLSCFRHRPLLCLVSAYK